MLDYTPVPRVQDGVLQTRTPFAVLALARRESPAGYRLSIVKSFFLIGLIGVNDPGTY